MSNPRNPPEIRRQIGREVLKARAERVRWKVLERQYGYTRARLRMLANAEVSATETDISILKMVFPI